MARLRCVHQRHGRTAAVILLLAMVIPSGGAAAETSQTLSLNQAVEMAIQADTDTAAARNDLEKANLSVQQEAANALPQITLTGQHGYDVNSADLSQNYTVKLQETFSTGIHLYGTGVASSIDVARWDRTSSEGNLQIQRANARYNTTVLYVNAWKARQTLRYQEAVVKNAQAAADLARKKLDIGKITKPDQIKAANDLAQAQYDLEKDRRDYDLALQELANQIGVTDGRSLVLDENLPADPLAGQDLVKMKKTALEKRPEIPQAKITIQKAEREMAQAKNDLLPALNLSYQDRDVDTSYGLEYSLLSGDLTGSVAWRENSSRYLNSSEESVFGSQDQAIALQLEYTLDWGIAQSKAQQAALTVDSARKALDQSIRDITLEVDQAVSDYEMAVSQLALKRQALSLYQKQLELAQLQQKLGKSTALDVSGAELELMSAQTDADNAAGDLLAAAEKAKMVMGLSY